MLQIPASPQLLQVQPWHRSGPNGLAWACSLFLFIMSLYCWCFYCFLFVLNFWCYELLVSSDWSLLLSFRGLPSSPYLSMIFYGLAFLFCSVLSKSLSLLSSLSAGKLLFTWYTRWFFIALSSLAWNSHKLHLKVSWPGVPCGKEFHLPCNPFKELCHCRGQCIRLSYVLLVCERK